MCGSAGSVFRIRIRIQEAPEYGSTTDPDPQHFYIPEFTAAGGLLLGLTSFTIILLVPGHLLHLEEVLQAGGEILVAGQGQVQLVEVGGGDGLLVAGQAGGHVGVLAPKLLLDHGLDLLIGLVGQRLLQQADKQLGELLTGG